MWEKTKSAFEGSKPVLVMVVVQMTLAGMNITFKLAANKGMDPTIIVAYRFLFATAFMGPLALIIERKIRPKLTRKVLYLSLICGVLGGSLGPYLHIKSIALTSATFVTAMSNLIPAVTFFLAVSFRMEKLGIGTPEGKAKVLGTALGIGGAMILSFFRGTELHIFPKWLSLMNNSHEIVHEASIQKDSASQPLGALLAMTSCLCFSLWFIVQAKISAIYPCQYTSTAFMCLWGAIIDVIVALSINSDWKKWKLGWDIRLLAVSYAGIIGSGLATTLVSWCVSKRGPLFVSVFNPLMLVMVAIGGALLLKEKTYLGRYGISLMQPSTSTMPIFFCVVGALTIVCALYMVLWGKAKDEESKPS